MPGPVPPPPRATPRPTATTGRRLDVPEGTAGEKVTVRTGDTYTAIVTRHAAYAGVRPPPSATEIARYNRQILDSRLEDSRRVFPGDEIFLPSPHELRAFRAGELQPRVTGGSDTRTRAPVPLDTDATVAVAPSSEDVAVMEDRGRRGAHVIRDMLPGTGDVVLARPGTYGGVTTGAPRAPRPSTGARAPEDLFDYANGAMPRRTPERPGFVGGVLRGTQSRPVFGEGGNWFTRGMSDAGNWIMDEIGSGLSGLVHKSHGASVDVPITDQLVLGFSVSGRKIPESELPPGDPRRDGILELNDIDEHRSMLPMWIEGRLGQDLGFDLSHDVALGPSGAYVHFGLSAAEQLDYSMQRLAYVPDPRGGLESDDAAQIARLALSPLSAAQLARMETGATFRFAGNANFRVDTALGIGTSVPALSNVMRVGAGVEVGAYGSLGGQFALQVQRMRYGGARMTLSSGGTAEAGAYLKLWAGVEVDHQELSRFLRGFVDYVADGGDPEAFRNQLSNERERELADNLGGYMRLLVKNIADGTGTAVMDQLIARYAASYLEARGGIGITSNFSTSIDFDLNSRETVVLPRADMVPASMRNGTAADREVRVNVGELSRLAYDMAMRGDLRLVQQLTLIRGSGVRVNERVTTETTGTHSEFGFKIPFIEYRREASTNRTVIDRFTPELGRTRTAIESFDRAYRGVFGDTEESSAQVRVHTPDGHAASAVFFGSGDNVSADLVVQNRVERWTDYEEMQDLVGVLNVLSNGRLDERIREALAQGEFREDTSNDLIEALFERPREYGRTIAHMHVWLGEEGLRELLDGDLDRNQLYAAIGQAFADMDPKGRTELPAWARRGADRRLLGEGAYSPDTYSSAQGDAVIQYDGGDRDLAEARYLVDNLMRLQTRMRAARTPAQEEAVAGLIRDFLRDAEHKLPTYAALASLVPEEQRAVEMRLTALRKGEAPIRFTYIQDGRASDLLYATGYARTAMQQYQRYQAILDTETRLRVGNLLGEMHTVLNAPSPDPYRLKTTMKALEIELGYLDERAVEMGQLIAEDIGAARVFLDGIPDANTIQALLPGTYGSQLANLRLSALRGVNAPQPDLFALRSIFTTLLERMPDFRRVAASSELVAATAHLANDLGESHPEAAELVGEATAAVGELREAIQAGDNDRFQRALDRVTAAHAELLAVAGDAASGTISISEGEASHGASVGAEVPTDGSAAPESVEAMAASRRESAERYRDLAGNAALAPVSYFERTGVVPAHYMGTPYESGGAGIVTGSMVREAELAMAHNRARPDLAIPQLSAESVERLVMLAKGGDAEVFLTAVEELAFQPDVVIEDPNKRALEYYLADIPVGERRAFLSHFSGQRQSALERIFSELDSVQNIEERKTDRWRRDRTYFLRNNPRFDDDLRFIGNTLRDDPQNLEAALNTLGYGRAIDNWHTRTTARLEGVLSRLDGDELDDLIDEMDSDERRRFHQLLRSSDLNPQTRAKLAGGIVDNNFMWRQQEELVEALVTGMDAADLRIFFDQLYVDGKLEDFLKPGSFWRTLLVIFTFGLALLFLHDNEAAQRVVAAQGWSPDELAADYATRGRFLGRVERDAEGILTNATLDTIPMDPGVRGGLRVLHTVIGNVKYYHFADLPTEAGRMLEEMAIGAGRQVVRRLGDIAAQGGSPSEIAAEYERFFAGLSPEAIRQQLSTADTDGSAATISKALADGAVAGLINAAYDPRNRFITVDVLSQILVANNQLDSPISIGSPSSRADNRLDAATYRGLAEKAAFYSQYTGFDFSQVRILVQGFTTTAQMTLGDTVSIPEANFTRNADGTLALDEYSQQVTCFHECSHILQQQIYGARVNAFIDQGFHIGASGDRNRAYRVTAEQFDAMRSIHDLSEHWEQQAELLEQSMRLLWGRAQTLGSQNPRLAEGYVAGQSLEVGGGTIELTPERWEKMIRFVHEWGEASRRTLGASGGRFEFTGTHDPR